ncbi:DNA oxidative demethylase ALKBH2 isoform X2 [Bos indicus]|uniref:DNA oxidative demethylase ALKBH2 isoform X2 n=1 Tax=Bos indicus TaxID=9915 RepID=A0ABM4QR97_BOSIN|nr:PREDICTED: DNA oxidative demethylase ALKBH2 isoform X2 [Bos indicus]XP_027422305.1 DNA oxidative demethylase ALKBH2 isoform X2 [Bos indicus x Bos taurus]
MDRFLVKGAVGSLKRRMEQEQTGGGPAGLAEEEGNSKKNPRRAAPGNGVDSAGLTWGRIRAEGLNCDYTILFGKAEADEIFQELEKEVEYFTGTKTARTTLASTGMMRENWLPGAQSPLSPLGPAETSSSGIRIPGGSTRPGGWRWSGSSWPMAAYS